MNMDLHIGTATSTDAASTQNGNVGHTFIENGHWTHWGNQMLALDSEKIDCFCLKRKYFENKNIENLTLS